MDSYIKNQLKRKVSSFILSEAGKVGNRNTFSTAALVTASSLAAMMLTLQHAHAQVNCGDSAVCGGADPYCCICTKGRANCQPCQQGDSSQCCTYLEEGNYWCSSEDISGDCVSCWYAL